MSAAREPSDGVARYEYFDRNFNTPATKLLPGEYAVTTENKALVTVLGSCVAACIRDVKLGIGGMNHFMLPDTDSSDPQGSSTRYGTHAMEVLINELMKLGARRSHFEAKVFGGGAVLSGVTTINVGHRNAEFVMKFLRMEHIAVVAHDLEDVHSRKVAYFPATGKAMVRHLNAHASQAQLVEQEKAYRRRIVEKPVAGDVELF